MWKTPSYTAPDLSCARCSTSGGSPWTCRSPIRGEHRRAGSRRGARRAIARRGFELRCTIARWTRTRAPRVARAPRVGSGAPFASVRRGLAPPSGRDRHDHGQRVAVERTVKAIRFPTRTSYERHGVRARSCETGDQRRGFDPRQSGSGASTTESDASNSLEERGSPAAASRRTVEIDRVRCRAFDEAPSLRVAPRRARRMCRSRSSTRAIKPRARLRRKSSSASIGAAIDAIERARSAVAITKTSDISHTPPI